MEKWFVGVREHLIFTPQGRVLQGVQLPGNYHDVHALSELLKTAFQGHLLGDNAYWAKPERANELAEHNIQVTAASRKSWKFQYPEITKAWLHGLRARVERRIGLFNRQLRAAKTLNRSRRHYRARRAAKILSHNAGRHVNVITHYPEESFAHFVA